jgi:hypothetical protein
MNAARNKIYEKYLNVFKTAATSKSYTLITADNIHDVKVILTGTFQNLNNGEEQVTKYSGFKILPPYILPSDFDIKTSGTFSRK